MIQYLYQCNASWDGTLLYSTDLTGSLCSEKLHRLSMKQKISDGSKQMGEYEETTRQ